MSFISQSTQVRVPPHVGLGPAPRVRGVVAFPQHPQWNAPRLNSHVYKQIRQYGAGNYDLVWHEPTARWWIVAVHAGEPRCVRVWQDEGGGYLPISQKMVDWLLASEIERVTRQSKPKEQARELDNRVVAAVQKQEAFREGELRDYVRSERHTMNKIHAKWQKRGFDPHLLKSAWDAAARDHGEKHAPK